MEHLIDKNLLVKYLMYVHESEYDSPISRIKLQKSLYFLYTFWIKTLNEASTSQNELSDLVTGLSDRLFESDFYAWSYGPVDREVYYEHRDGQLGAFNSQEARTFEENVYLQSEFVAQYLISMTRRIFNTSDFGLVDLSHRDSSWIDNYDPKDPFPNTAISHTSMVNDYVQ